jgi:polysaccharide export outer membrane protein
VKSNALMEAPPQLGRLVINLLLAGVRAIQMRFPPQTFAGLLATFCFPLTPSSAQAYTAGPPASLKGNVDTRVSSAAPATSQSILGAADVIRVSVWKSPDLSQTVTVGPDGFISLPLIGEVHVAGMTANQLEQSLASLFSSYMINPQVTVSVVDIRSRQVYVLGQVAKPGGYPLIGPVTVLQLIAEAGGLGIYANSKEIIILRTTNNGTRKIFFNYKSVIHGDGKANINLQPGDTVVVP